jgi:hypothetical protein
VAGKDVVPRVGLHQLETLRHDLMDAIKRSKKNKVSFYQSRRNGDILGLNGEDARIRRSGEGCYDQLRIGCQDQGRI